MKKCKDKCCTAICDFCEHYNFNPDEEGAYIGLGYCKKHKKGKDPYSWCDDFECEYRKKELKKEKKDETTQN